MVAIAEDSPLDGPDADGRFPGARVGVTRGMAAGSSRIRSTRSNAATVPRLPVAVARQPTGCIRTRPFSSSIVLASSLTNA